MTRPDYCPMAQEPCQAMCALSDVRCKIRDSRPQPAAPQRSEYEKQWVGLTDVEWMNIVNKNQAWFGMRSDDVAQEVCKLTEAKLKEKNT